MADEWSELTIDAIKAPSDRAIAIGPFGSRMKADTYVERGVPVIRGNNISDTRALAGDFVYVSDETADELRACNVYADDLVFPHRGAIGQVAIVPSDGVERYMLSTSLMKLTCDKRRVDPRYVFYFFRSELGRHALLQNASTVGTPGIGQPLSSLRSIRLPVPPLPEQRAIADILGTLDDKIELNRRMNETLEAMARALFKSWFVDFDPVRAKSEGRDPGLPQPLADLFPSRLVDSEVGEIPEGWEVVSLEALAHIHGGKQLPTEDCKPSGAFPVFGANGIMGYADCASHDGFVIAFGRVGAYCGSVHWTYGGAWVNNNASSVVPKHSPEFVLQAMLMADFKGMRTGSAQPFIPNSSLALLQVVRPADIILDKFCAGIRSLRLKEQLSKKDAENLADLRDTLLPKLLSGELRLRHAEGFLECAPC